MSIKLKPVNLDKLRVKVWIDRKKDTLDFPNVVGLSCEEILFDREVGDCSGIEAIKIYFIGVRREWNEYLISDFSPSTCNDNCVRYTINKNNQAKFKQDFLLARCK